jgi:Type IV pili methyl-accepting chemotaxis transducer N-term
MQRRRWMVWGTASWALGSPLNSWGQITDPANAINKAGRQRALSQRLSKSYLMLGLGIETADAQRVLSDSVAMFDRFLVELKAYAPSAEIRETYDAVDATWQRVKALAVGSAPSRDNAAKLLALDAQLLQAAQLGTLQFQQATGRPGAALVNTAGRQRMLSQRIAKFQFCRAWDVGLREASVEIARSREEFMAAMTLLGAQARTAPQKQSLETAQNQWVFFAAALDASSSTANATAQSKLARASELILTAFDEVTLAFERGG